MRYQLTNKKGEIIYEGSPGNCLIALQQQIDMIFDEGVLEARLDNYGMQINPVINSHNKAA